MPISPLVLDCVEKKTIGTSSFLKWSPTAIDVTLVIRYSNLFQLIFNWLGFLHVVCTQTSAGRSGCKHCSFPFAPDQEPIHHWNLAAFGFISIVTILRICPLPFYGNDLFIYLPHLSRRTLHFIAGNNAITQPFHTYDAVSVDQASLLHHLSPQVPLMIQCTLVL